MQNHLPSPLPASSIKTILSTKKNNPPLLYLASFYFTKCIRYLLYCKIWRAVIHIGSSAIRLVHKSSSGQCWYRKRPYKWHIFLDRILGTKTWYCPLTNWYLGSLEVAGELSPLQHSVVISPLLPRPLLCYPWSIYIHNWWKAGCLTGALPYIRTFVRMTLENFEKAGSAYMQLELK